MPPAPPAGPPRRTSSFTLPFPVRLVPTYCPPAVPADRADTVVFLGDLVEVPSHYQLATAQQKGRSVPCDGEGCPHCQAGHSPRVCWYAPALICQHGDHGPDGQRVWERVVYYIPEAAVEGFGTDGLRGRQFSVWRKRVGSSDRIRSRFDGRCADLSEPWFDVWPVLNHVFHKSEGTRLALDQLLRSMPPRVSPPRFRKDADTLPPAMAAKVEALTQQGIRDYLRQNLPGWKPANERPADPEQKLLDQGHTVQYAAGPKARAAVEKNRQQAKRQGGEGSAA